MPNKRLVYIALVAVLLLAILPVNVSAEVISGEWGDSAVGIGVISWNLDTGTGILTLMGDGKESYSSSPSNSFVNRA